MNEIDCKKLRTLKLRKTTDEATTADEEPWTFENVPSTSSSTSTSGVADKATMEQLI